MRLKDKKWKEIRPNVFTKDLAKDIKKNQQLDLMKLKADTTFKTHSHPAYEWIYILKGEMSDERGTFNKGDFLINEKDSIHTVKVGKKGCIILCLWCGIVVPV